MYNTQDIANRIKMILLRKGKPVGEMLSDLNLGINTISEMSKGKQLSYLRLADIADYLDVSIDYILGRTNDNTPLSYHSRWDDLFRDRLALILPTFDREDLIAGGVDLEEYSAIINGTTPISFDTACYIADELGISLDFLANRTEETDVNY